VIPGTEVGAIGEDEERFIDNRRIEGTVENMLDEALRFVKKNTKIKTVIDSKTGKRRDIEEYPTKALREVILNALVHRDYSIHTEGKPIQMQIFTDRIVISNPGGLYGRISLSQLGQIQPDTRNPVLATALETMKITENRYSGIPTIRKELSNRGLPMPQFEDKRGSFIVTLFGERKQPVTKAIGDRDILSFCSTPRTRQEIADFLGVKSVAYVMKTYIAPLVDANKIELSNPAHPKSPNQKYTTKKV
jgi:ATP-dependent DNA helicase RecG